MDAPTGELLQHGEMEIVGRMPWSSNATFVVSLWLDGAAARAVVAAFEAILASSSEQYRTATATEFRPGLPSTDGHSEDGALGSVLEIGAA